MSRPVEPRPLKWAQCRTVVLRVPSGVWGLISTGAITEFRASAGNAPQLWKVPLPTLAVAYRRRLSRQDYDYRLMVLEGVRREALGAITPEGLALAGFEGPDAFAHFRRAWMLSEKRRFEPLRRTFVYTLHPIGEGDLERVGAGLVEHLYGRYLEAHDRPRTLRAA